MSLSPRTMIKEADLRARTQAAPGGFRHDGPSREWVRDHSTRRLYVTMSDILELRD